MSVTLALVAEAAMQTAARWESKRRGKQRGWRAGEKAVAMKADAAGLRGEQGGKEEEADDEEADDDGLGGDGRAVAAAAME